MINGSIFHLPLADRSVHCIVFSPPYYGLRDYGLDPIIIGGEVGCVHEWGSGLAGKASNRQHLDERSDGGGNKASSVSHGYDSAGSFCLNCSAWRGSLGLEPTPELFIEHCRIYARECWRVLRDDGTMWVNIGASYAGSWGSQSKSLARARRGGFNTRSPTSHPHSVYKPKDLIPTPWLFAIALQQDGWYLRSDIIWQKPNPMPESVTDRPTRSHEYVFLFSKSKRYFYDADAVREITGNEISWNNYKQTWGKIRKVSGIQADNAGADKKDGNKSHPNGRNLRSVWTIPTHGFSEAHFATFPPRLIEPMIKAGTSEGGVCIECGSQFERVVDKEQTIDRRWSKQGGLHRADVPGQELSKSSVFRTGKYKINHTLGFRPTCKHYDPLYHIHFPMARNKRKRYQQFKTGHWWKRVKKRPVPLNWPTDKAIILDPFGGAGTTELVSTSLGRQGVSIELSFDYCQMAVKRLKSGGKRIPPRLVKLIEQGQRQMFNEHKIEVKGDKLETLDQIKIEQLDMFGGTNA